MGLIILYKVYKALKDLVEINPFHMALCNDQSLTWCDFYNTEQTLNMLNTSQNHGVCTSLVTL